MNRQIIKSILFSLIVLAFIGCGSSSVSQNNTTVSGQTSVAPLNPANVNYVFVVSPDLKYNTSGDIDPNTANLTPQGLNRSLTLASYLQQSVLGNQNVTAIYALQPMSHLQTSNNYPDMAGIEFIQQFAMLNQMTLPIQPSGTLTAYSFAINTSYGNGIFPSQVPPSVNPTYCQNCQGLSFLDTNGSNSAIITSIENNNTSGYYVFSAPWETIVSLMATVKAKYNAQIDLPLDFNGSNMVYAISVNPSNKSLATLTTYNSAITPSSSYPVLSQISTSNPCQALPFNITASEPKYPNINKNQTVYFIRHAEAHPNGTSWDNGNYVAAGQWRALSLPTALKNKINPSMVISSDPAQIIHGSNSFFSYVRPSLTAQPYAIANNLPYSLASGFNWNNVNDAITYFFFNSAFAGKTILVAWEHDHIQEIVNTLSGTSVYKVTTNPNGNQAVWNYNDYDSIWTVTLDSNGALSVNNSMCEGINSSTLPNTAPQF